MSWPAPDQVRLQLSGTGPGLAGLVEWALAAGARRVQAELPDGVPREATVPAGLRLEGRLRQPSGPDLLVLGRVAGDVDPGVDALPTIASSMPRVLRAAGWYISDPDGRVLMVDPIYKPGLDLPGGIAEAGETLTGCARRELSEELGLHLPVGDLLVVDFCLDNGRRPDIELSVVDGGVHPPELSTEVRFTDGEIAAAHWVHPDALDGRCPDSLVRRVRAVHAARGTGRLPGPTLLLREGFPTA